MEIEVLKKKISTYKGPKGRLCKITDPQLLHEILLAWESWTGQKKQFFTAIGVSHTGFASVIGRAKRLKREGHFPAEEFKEVQLPEGSSLPNGSGPYGILLRWEDKRVIKFREVDQLVEFLKKVP